LVFTAHTDHPGFVALKMRNVRTLRAAFRGWVEPEYFVGTKVRFWSGGRWVSGKVEQILKTAKLYRMIGRTARPEEVAVRVAGAVEAQSPGMWDLPDPYEKNGCVYARGCDDIAGCAAMLALLERLSRRRARADVYCLFTRAEEVGFVGAIGAAKTGTIPKRLPIIAIETSKALMNAKIGDGPILRVGDKSSVFTPEVTAFCYRVAQDLAEKKKTFRYQRKLMDGGTCESTAYYAYGYAATGMCVALGNYHNMDMERKRIDSEYISLADWHGMVDWFEALALAAPGYGVENDTMRKGLEKRFADWQKYL
jgi:endoglucanase